MWMQIIKDKFLTNLLLKSHQHQYLLVLPQEIQILEQKF